LYLVPDTNPDTLSEERSAQALSLRCEEFNTFSEKPYYVELSCGFTEFKCDKDVSLPDIIEPADKELYKAKISRRKNPFK